MSSYPEPAVFVSYASDDREIVSQVVDRLRGGGITAWMDQHRIAGGLAWAQEIVQSIRRCRVLLLMGSDAAMRSRAVAQEVQLAWKYRLAYVPVMLHPTRYTEQVEFFLEGLQWIDAHGAEPAAWVPKIVEALGRFGIVAGQPRVTLEVAPPTPNLDGLRRIASFTDRVWPLIVDQVDRSTASVRYLVRDLGPARQGARHEVRLGSRLFWAIDWDEDAYLLLLNQGAEGKTYCLCPSWFCPDTHLKAGISMLPPEAAHSEPFVVTGQPGREHILAILSTEPLAEAWMPPDPTTPARELSVSDIDDLTGRIQRSDAGTWTALATYCDVTVDD